MKKRFFEVARKESYLSDYDGQHLGSECKEGNVDCYTKKILSLLSNFNDSNEVVEENSTGCEICRTKNGKPRSLFVMTDANQTITDIKFYHVCGAKM